MIPNYANQNERYLDEFPATGRPELLTVKEAAGMLRMTRGAIYDWLSDGKLTRVKLGEQGSHGAKVLVRRSELEAIIAAGTVPARWQLVPISQPKSVIPIRAVESR